MRLEALSDKHDRAAFHCGVAGLDGYFKTQVTQDLRRRVSACYVAVEEATQRLAGYDTLAAAGVPWTDLSASVVKRLPRYPSVPVVRMAALP